MIGRRSLIFYSNDDVPTMFLCCFTLIYLDGLDAYNDGNCRLEHDADDFTANESGFIIYKFDMFGSFYF